MYEGSFEGSKVCVKRIQTYIQDVERAVAKVYIRHPLFSGLSSLTNSELLQRGLNVEIFKAPKRFAPSGNYCHAIATHFKLGVRR